MSMRTRAGIELLRHGDRFVPVRRLADELELAERRKTAFMAARNGA